MLATVAPAKLNLTLEILYRRSDGYHELDTIFCAIDLCDRLSIRPGKPGIRIVSNSNEIPTGVGNLAYKAIQAIRNACAIKDGVDLALEKNIPISAGLGGGSSDAAAAIRLMNRLFELDLSLERMKEIALQIGSDVPFFLEGGLARGKGRGEILQPAPEPENPLNFLLVNSGIRTSAALVYGKYAERNRSDDSRAKHSDKELTTKGAGTKLLNRVLRSGKPAEIGALLQNDLEPAALSMFPGLTEVRKRILESNAKGAIMSGSGGTVFGLYRNAADAEEAGLEIGRNQPGWRAIVARSIGCAEYRKLADVVKTDRGER